MFKRWMIVSALWIAGAAAAEATNEPPIEDQNVSSSQVELHGRALTSAFAWIQHPRAGRMAQKNFSVWPELSWSDQNWGAKVIAYGHVFGDSLESPSQLTTDAGLWDAWVRWSQNGIEIQAGWLLVPWGKSDGVNPTDVLTAKDFRFLSLDDELRRRGDWGLRTSWTPQGGNSPWNWETVIQLRAPQSQLLLPNLNVPTGLTLRTDVTERSRPTVATRLQYLESDWDASLSFYRGTSTLPQFEYQAALSRVQAFYVGLTSVGADFSSSLGNSQVLRIETAFLFPDNGSSNDLAFGRVQPHHWDTVIGLEHAFDDSWRVQVQALVRHHWNFRPVSEVRDPNPVVTQIQQAIARSNALVLNFPEATNPGGSVRFSYDSIDRTWNASVSVLGYLAAGSQFLVRPRVTYAPADSWKITGGADFYGGNENLTLGALRGLSTVSAEVAWFF